MEHLQTLDLSYEECFKQFYEEANTLCVTLKPKPGSIVDEKFLNYCIKNHIDFYLTKEVAGQVHYHGMISYPEPRLRKNFQKWFNRNYGFFYVSHKYNDWRKWYQYVHKDIPETDYQFVEEE